MLMKLRQNPSYGYEAEDSPVIVENLFLSPGSAEPACPSGAAALGHSERLGGENAKGGEKALCLVTPKCLSVYDTPYKHHN